MNVIKRNRIVLLKTILKLITLKLIYFGITDLGDLAKLENREWTLGAGFIEVKPARAARKSLLLLQGPINTISLSLSLTHTIVACVYEALLTHTFRQTNCCWCL